jgi:hypothetical protein
MLSESTDMEISYLAFFDELEKIAEDKPAITKERLRKGIGIAGGVGAATGAGILVGRGIRHMRREKLPAAALQKRVPGLKKIVKRYGPIALMAGGLGTKYLSSRMRQKIDESYKKAK